MKRKLLFLIFCLGVVTFAWSTSPTAGVTFVTGHVSIGANQGWNIYAPWEVRRDPDRMLTQDEIAAGHLLSPNMSFSDWAKTAKATWVAMIEPKPFVVDYAGGVYSSDPANRFLPKVLRNREGGPEESSFKLVYVRKYLNSSWSTSNQPKWIYEFKDPSNPSAPHVFYVYKDVEYKWEFQSGMTVPSFTITKKYIYDYDFETPHYIDSWDYPEVEKLLAQPWDPGVAPNGDTVDVVTAEKALFHVYVTLKYKRAQVKLKDLGSGSYAIDSFLTSYEESAPGNNLWVGGFPVDIYNFTWGDPFDSYNNEFGGGKSGFSVTYIEDYRPPETIAQDVTDIVSIKKRVIDKNFTVEAKDNNPNNPKTKVTFEYTVGKYEVFYDDLNGDGVANPNDPEDRVVILWGASYLNPTSNVIYFGVPDSAPSPVAPKRIHLTPQEREKYENGENFYIHFSAENYWVTLPEEEVNSTPSSTPQHTKVVVDTSKSLLALHSSVETDDDFETKTTVVKASDCCGNVTTTTAGKLKPHDDVKPNLCITILPAIDEEEDFASAYDGEYKYFTGRDYYIPNGDSIDFNVTEINKKKYGLPPASVENGVTVIKDSNGHYYGRWINDDEEWTYDDNYVDGFGNNLLASNEKIYSPPARVRVKFIMKAVDNNDRIVNNVDHSYIQKDAFWIENEHGEIIPEMGQKVTRDMGPPPAPGQLPPPWKNFVYYHAFKDPGTYYVCYEAWDFQGNHRLMRVKLSVYGVTYNFESIDN